MAKILYPVGTEVTLRKYPEAGVFTVVEYIKGEKFPYRVENAYGDKGQHGKSKFSIKGLKRYNPTQADETKKSESVDSPSRSYGVERPELTKDVYTKEEVNELVEAHYLETLELLQMVNHTADKALAGVRKVSRITDGNFIELTKYLKTLSHDDD